MTTTTVLDRPTGPPTTTEPVSEPVGTHDDLPKLTAEQLYAEQQRTLATARRPYSVAARALFLAMDLLYGRRRSLTKYRVLEIVARVPYQSWETATYKRMTRRHRYPADVRELWDRVREFRAQQDNEQWHLLIIDELVTRHELATSGRGNRFWSDLLPRLIAFGYWHFSWLLYVLKPQWSHRLNADFEDHAEHEYAEFVADNPHWEFVPYHSQIAAGYGRFACLADLFRQIGHDERLHKRESEQHLEPLRVGRPA